MLDLFHQEFLSKKDDEEASFYESFIYRWVLDLISFDEQPSNKIDISTHAVTHTILDLYEHSLLNSAHFKKEVQDRIIYSSCQKEKISQKLGIKKPIFNHANVIGTPQ